MANPLKKLHTLLHPDRTLRFAEKPDLYPRIEDLQHDTRAAHDLLTIAIGFRDNGRVSCTCDDEPLPEGADCCPACQDYNALNERLKAYGGGE